MDKMFENWSREGLDTDGFDLFNARHHGQGDMDTDGRRKKDDRDIMTADEMIPADHKNQTITERLCQGA